MNLSHCVTWHTRLVRREWTDEFDICSNSICYMHVGTIMNIVFLQSPFISGSTIEHCPKHHLSYHTTLPFVVNRCSATPRQIHRTRAGANCIAGLLLSLLKDSSDDIDIFMRAKVVIQLLIRSLAQDALRSLTRVKHIKRCRESHQQSDPILIELYLTIHDIGKRDCPVSTVTIELARANRKDPAYYVSIQKVQRSRSPMKWQNQNYLHLSIFYTIKMVFALSLISLSRSAMEMIDFLPLLDWRWRCIHRFSRDQVYKQLCKCFWPWWRVLGAKMRRTNSLMVERRRL